MGYPRGSRLQAGSHARLVLSIKLRHNVLWLCVRIQNRALGDPVRFTSASLSR